MKATGERWERVIVAESSDLSEWPRPRDCPPPVAESRAIAVCAAIGERGRCFVTDEDTEYRKRTASDAAAPSARKISGTATGIVHRVEKCGRIVIPKEIRRTLRIREGDPLQTTLTPIDRFCWAIHSVASRYKEQAR